jgi:hypothetical protein
MASMTLLMLILACSDAPAPDTDPPTDTAADCSGCSPSEASLTSQLDPSVFSTDVNRTRDNPLKGFMTSYLWGEPANDFPDQLEFLYLPMADLWNEEGETLESGLEPHLMAAETRGHHAVVRVYIDYPNSETGLPGYLAGLVDCEPYDHSGVGCSPDYDDPDLVQAMLGLIAAMGERYDADNRLGFIQVGLLGFWGEWHTYPYTEWFPSEETQTAVLEAFDSAFQTTQIQVRRTAANSVDLRIGFHDDSFAYSTLGDVGWFFLPGLETAGAANRWQNVAIGGELRPELQETIFNEDYELGTYAQDISECIEATHASYLLNYYAFNGNGQGYVDEPRNRAEQAALLMGYQFEIQGASLSASGLSEREVEIQLEVELTQTGVAPFYYPVFLVTKSDFLSEPLTSNEISNSLLPGETQTITVDLGRVPVDVMNGPISLALDSPILQDGQEIALATLTPWTESSGPIVLVWEILCDVDGEVYRPGDVAGQSAQGCACTCDVDGELRGCGGETCG